MCTPPCMLQHRCLCAHARWLCAWCVLVCAQATTASLQEAMDRENAASLLADGLQAQLRIAREQCEVPQSAVLCFGVACLCLG